MENRNQYKECAPATPPTHPEKNHHPEKKTHHYHHHQQQQQPQPPTAVHYAKFRNDVQTAK